MFCGQCGRAISSADWAAYRKARGEADAEAAAAAADEAASRPVVWPEVSDAERARADSVQPAEEPSWSRVEPPAASVPAGTPWWVSEASGDDAGSPEGEGEQDPGAVAEAGTPDEETIASVAGARAARPASAVEPRVPVEPVASTAPVAPAAPAEPAPPDAPAEPAAPPAPPAAEPAPSAPLAVPSPAPLRPPGSASSTGRPSSVPLWTASLTPITDSGEPAASDANPADTSAAASSTTPEPDAAPAEPTAPAEPAAPAEPGLAAPDTATSSNAGAPDPAPLAPTSDSEAARAAAAPEPAAPKTPADEPRPGDTNVIPPLVAPRPERIDGRLHCTVCGAPLADDDIFCGECGTVVQSVAQSFTGPITPILTGVVPIGEASVPVDPGEEGSEHEADPAAATPSAAAPAADPVAAPRPAPLAPTPVPSEPSEPSVPPFVAEPEKPRGKKRRLFGRRAAEPETPKLWSAPETSAAPAQTDAPVPPMPAPPAADHTSIGAGQPAQAPADPPIRADQVPAATPDDAPASPAQAPLAATPIDAPEQTAAPVVAPLPPAPVVDRPAAPWAINLGAPVDDVENTRIVQRQPLGEPFILQFSTGESFTVQGTGLVGRAPTPQPGEAIDLLVRIVDPGRSVSKTHLEFGQEDGALWVSDRWSGNGSVVRAPSAEARRVEPGKRVRVPRGSRVEIGEQFFIVS